MTSPLTRCCAFCLLHATLLRDRKDDKAWITISAQLRCIPPQSQTISQRGPTCTFRPDKAQDTDTGAKRNCSPARSTRERKKRRNHILLGSAQHNVAVDGPFLCSQENSPREIHLPLDRQMDAGYGSHRLRHLCRGVRADAGNRQICPRVLARGGWRAHGLTCTARVHCSSGLRTGGSSRRAHRTRSSSAARQPRCHIRQTQRSVRDSGNTIMARADGADKGRRRCRPQRRRRSRCGGGGGASSIGQARRERVDAVGARSASQRCCIIGNDCRPSNVVALHRRSRSIHGVLLNSFACRWDKSPTAVELTVDGDSNPPPMCCVRRGGFYFDGHGGCWFGLDSDKFTVRWGGRRHSTVAA